MNLRFTLIGTSPLLLHKADVEANDELDRWRKDPENKKKGKPGDDRSPAWTWMMYTPHDGKHIAMPAEWLMACLRGAGSSVILQKQTTYKSLTQSGLIIPDEFCEFRTGCDKHGDGGKQVRVDAYRDLIDKDAPWQFSEHANRARELGFKLFLKHVTVGRAKHVRVRPRFDNWAVSGTIQIIDPDFKLESLERIFEIAGSNKGLGDWRPGCKGIPGPYGRFSVRLMTTK